MVIAMHVVTRPASLLPHLYDFCADIFDGAGRGGEADIDTILPIWGNDCVYREEA